MSGASTNWTGNLTYSATSIHHPASVAEVQQLVAQHSRVKALGTRHSFNTIADSSGGALISLSELPPEIEVDTSAMTVSVTGGTRYGVLAAQLQSQGYALHNTGSLPHISVAGATATGTHGSGDRNKILSTAVAAVDLVTSDGTLVTIDRTNPDLKALAVGLGAFGVITRLVLEIQPTYLVRQDVYRNPPWDTVLKAFDEVMASAYSVSLIGDFGSPVIRELWQKRRVEQVGEGQDPPQPVPESLHGGTWYDDAEEPPGHSLNVRGGVPGPWSKRLPHFASIPRRRPAGMSCRPSTSSTGATPSTRSGPCGRSAIASHPTCTRPRSAPPRPTTCGSAPPTSVTVCASASPGASIPPRSWPCWPTSRLRSRPTSRDPTGASCSCPPPRTSPDASPGSRSSPT